MLLRNKFWFSHAILLMNLLIKLLSCIIFFFPQIEITLNSLYFSWSFYRITFGAKSFQKHCIINYICGFTSWNSRYFDLYLNFSLKLCIFESVDNLCNWWFNPLLLFSLIVFLVDICIKSSLLFEGLSLWEKVKSS
jgi:hypothetical protein